MCTYHRYFSVHCKYTKERPGGCGWKWITMPQKHLRFNLKLHLAHRNRIANLLVWVLHNLVSLILPVPSIAFMPLNWFPRAMIG